MRSALRVLVLSSAALAGLTARAGTVEVNFVHPETYADIGSRQSDSDANMQALAGHLKALGARWLPAEQTLRIDVLDVDLAGELRPSRAAANPVRVVTGESDYPSMHLHWTLSGAGLQRSADERVADLNYTRGLRRRGDSTSLEYDKRMLTAWFKERFAPGRGD